MSLRHGRPLVMIPGPSVMPDRVLNAMRRPIPNIYEGEVVDLTYSLLERLPALARTEHRAYIAISNGHGAWEMATTNTLSRGDKVLVLEVGHFATNWAEMAAMSGVKFEVLHAPDRAAIEFDAVLDRLRADVGREFAAVFVAQTDTSTTVRNDIAAVRRALDEADHPALLMADCVASLGCEPFEMDAWGVDVTVAGSQKGLMVPPGPGHCVGGPEGMGSAPASRPAHRLLGLVTQDRSRRPLLDLLRHPAGPAPVGPRRGAGHDRRGGSGEHLGSSRGDGTRRACCGGCVVGAGRSRAERACPVASLELGDAGSHRRGAGRPDPPYVRRRSRPHLGDSTFKATPMRRSESGTWGT